MRKTTTALAMILGTAAAVLVAPPADAATVSIARFSAAWRHTHSDQAAAFRRHGWTITRRLVVGPAGFVWRDCPRPYALDACPPIR
jgi:hypothetical protein